MGLLFSKELSCIILFGHDIILFPKANRHDILFSQINTFWSDGLIIFLLENKSLGLTCDSMQYNNNKIREKLRRIRTHK